jgi:membrane carboxypeptidase/penicillin-binding protein PbpC
MTDRDKLIEAMARGMAIADGAFIWAAYYDDAQAALAAIEANGFAVVPVEPSAVQIAAGWRYAFQQSAQCYRAMIAAAPMQGDG